MHLAPFIYRAITSMLILAALIACSLGQVPSKIKIIGGTKASQPYPFFVSLIEGPGSSPFCGASLIDTNIVLTAAHCAVDLPGTLSVRFEQSALANDNTSGDSSGADLRSVEIPVRRLIVHEEFNPTKMSQAFLLNELADPLAILISSLQTPMRSCTEAAL